MACLLKTDKLLVSKRNDIEMKQVKILFHRSIMNNFEILPEVEINRITKFLVIGPFYLLCEISFKSFLT